MDFDDAIFHMLFGLISLMFIIFGVVTAVAAPTFIAVIFGPFMIIAGILLTALIINSVRKELRR